MTKEGHKKPPKLLNSNGFNSYYNVHVYARNNVQELLTLGLQTWKYLKLTKSSIAVISSSRKSVEILSSSMTQLICSFLMPYPIGTSFAVNKKYILVKFFIKVTYVHVLLKIATSMYPKLFIYSIFKVISSKTKCIIHLIFR